MKTARHSPVPLSVRRAAKAAAALAALAGIGACRILETGYGEDNILVRTSADAAAATAGAARSTVSWAGTKVLSFADDLTPEKHQLLIGMGELAAAAYRAHPDLPDGWTPLADGEFAALGLPADRYRYESATGFLEDADAVGFGARLAKRSGGGGIAVAFRGSNAPGEDEHWMQDWIDDAHQGGGGTPAQYVYGAEVLAAVRRAFPDAELAVAGHSLGGGIAAHATIGLENPGRLFCATYNAAGISGLTLLALPGETVDRAAARIVNVRSKGDPVSAIPGTQLVGDVYEVDNLRVANHAIDGLLLDMRRRAEGRRPGWLRDLFDD